MYGEERETLNHLLFQCRISREVFELAPCHTVDYEQVREQSLLQNMISFLILSSSVLNTTSLSPFLGWRLWKMRNSLIFQNKRLFIPQIISQAILDQKLWNESRALAEDHPASNSDHSSSSVVMNEVFRDRRSYYYFVDASWVSSDNKIGIAWALYHHNGQQILQARTAEEHVPSPLHAEALALLFCS